MTGSEQPTKAGAGLGMKILVVAILAVAVGAVLYGKGQPGGATPSAGEAMEGPALPRLVDLGADKCIPCIMMAPILEELRNEYAGRLAVEFIDVWKNPGAGNAYGIRMIPTQIFFDASGKELFRHQGFFGKADILAKWKELGVELGDNP